MSKSSSGYFRNIFCLGIGSIIAQLFNLASQPILTRLLPTETIGIYSYLVSLANVVIPVAALKVDMLIVNEKDDDEAQYITDACFILMGVVAAAFTVVIYTASFLGTGDLRRYRNFLWLPVLLTISEGIRYICISYSNRYKQYKMISRIAIIREGTRAGLQVLDAFLLKSAFGQMLGQIAAPLLGSKQQLHRYLEKRKDREKITWCKFKKVLYKSRQQILYIAPSQFFNTFAYSTIAFSIVSLYSAEELGFYSISIKVLGLPMLYVTTNVSKVIFRQIGEMKNKGLRTAGFLLKNIAGLLLLSGGGFSVLYFVAPTACRYIFGERYYIAGLYIRELCLMFAVRFVSTSMAGLFTAFHKQKYELFFNLGLLLATFLAYVAASIFQYDIFIYLRAVNILSAVIYGSQITGYLLTAQKSDCALGTADQAD